VQAQAAAAQVELGRSEAAHRVEPDDAVNIGGQIGHGAVETGESERRTVELCGNHVAVVPGGEHRARRASVDQEAQGLILPVFHGGV
jgi:hypothetical protein